MALVAKGLANTVIDADEPTLAGNIDWISSGRFLPVQRFVVNDDSLPTIPVNLIAHPNHAYTQLNGTGTFSTDSGTHIVQHSGITGTTTKSGNNLVLTGDANYSSVQLTSDTAISYTSSGGTNLDNSGLDVAVTESIAGGSFTAPIMDVTNFAGITGLDAAFVPTDGSSVTRIALVAGQTYDFQVSLTKRNSGAGAGLVINSTSADPGLSLTTASSSTVGSTNNNNFREAAIVLDYTPVGTDIPSNYDRAANATRIFRETGANRNAGVSLIREADNVTLHRTVFQFRKVPNLPNPGNNATVSISISGTATVNNVLTVINANTTIIRDIVDSTSSRYVSAGATDAGDPQLTGDGTASILSFINNTGGPITIEGTTIANGTTGTPTISGTVDITSTFQATVTNNGLAAASVATGTSTTARTIAVNASEVYSLGTNSSGSLTGSWVNVTPFTVTPTGSTPTGTGISLSTTALTNGSLSAIRLNTVTAPLTGTLYTHTISNSLELTEEIANAASTLGFTTAGNGYLNLSAADNTARSASRTTMTISCWVKKSWIGSGAGVNAEGEPILSSANDGNNYTEIRLSTPTTAGGPTNASIRLLHRDSGTANIDVRTVDGQEFDWNEWTHVVVAVDTTQTISTDRVKIYLNGVLKEGSDLQTATYPSLNKGLDWEGSIHTDGLRIGDNNIGNEFSGNIADFYYIDNQQLTATDFGTTNQTIWIPADYTGTMNTASFHLDFSNASNLGNDTSSNNIDFTTVSSNFNVPRGSGPTITQASAQQSPNTPTNNIPNLLGADDVNSSSNVRFLNNGYTLAGPSGVTNNGRLVSTTGIFEDDRRYYFELYFQHRTGGTSSSVKALLWPSTNQVNGASGNDAAFLNAFGGGTTVSSLRYYAVDTGTGNIWFSSTSSSTTAYGDGFRMAVESADTTHSSFALNYKDLGITTDQLRFTYHDYTSNAGGSASTYVNLGQATMYNNPPAGYTTVVQGLPNITTNVNQLIAEEGTFAVANATSATGLFAENITHDANALGTFGGVTIAEEVVTPIINVVNQALPAVGTTNNFGVTGLSVVRTSSTGSSEVSGAFFLARNGSRSFGNSGSSGGRAGARARGDNGRITINPSGASATFRSGGGIPSNQVRGTGSGPWTVTVTENADVGFFYNQSTTTNTYAFTNNSGRTLNVQGTTLDGQASPTLDASGISVVAGYGYDFNLVLTVPASTTTSLFLGPSNTNGLTREVTSITGSGTVTTIGTLFGGPTRTGTVGSIPLVGEGPFGSSGDTASITASSATTPVVMTVRIRGTATTTGTIEVRETGWVPTITDGPGTSSATIAPVSSAFDITSDGEWNITATNNSGGDILVDPVIPNTAVVRIQSTNTSPVAVVTGLTGLTRPAFDLDIATPAITSDGMAADSRTFTAFIDANGDALPIAVEADGRVNAGVIGLDLSNFTGTFTTA